MEKMRVRAILSKMPSLTKAELKKLLPSKIKAPETSPIRYPNALLSSFPKGESYSLLGWVAEEMLRLPVLEINMDSLISATKKWYPEITEESIIKIRNSKTTPPFLDHMISTRNKIDSVAIGALRFEETVTMGSVEGHPDSRTDTQIFEVKMTGMLQENWQDFLYQIFAYASLTTDTVTDIYLVLPMQEIVWHYNVAEWTHRRAYADLLNTTVETIMSNGENDAIWGANLRETCHIGSHIRKEKSLVDTVRRLGDYSKPYQIFLCGSQNSKLQICDKELLDTAVAVLETGARIYVHSQYIINLCQPPNVNEGFHTRLLIKNLQYAVIAGFKGVVVHVGKSTDKPVVDAIENMRQNLLLAMEHATADCPILLETPAGQGTETLCAYRDFVEFVLKFADPRLRICVDTCHVFACASSGGPLSYLERLTTYNRKLLKLVHYNDSACPYGSCLDRHAFMGTGHIGVKTMTQIAELCNKHSVPMVIE